MITKSLIGPDFRVLTLVNPWPRSITHYGKRTENRTWRPPEGLVDVFGIHAGKSGDPAAAGFLRSIGVDPIGPHEGPKSAIVGVARLAGVCSDSFNRPRLMCDCGVWAAAGQHHWNLDEDVFVLPDPIPSTGRLGLWRPASDVLDAVRRQLP